MHNRLLITVSMGSISIQELLYQINFLLALNTSCVPPCEYLGITHLSENTVRRSTFDETWVQRHPWD